MADTRSRDTLRPKMSSHYRDMVRAILFLVSVISSLYLYLNSLCLPLDTASHTRIPRLRTSCLRSAILYLSGRGSPSARIPCFAANGMHQSSTLIKTPRHLSFSCSKGSGACVNGQTNHMARKSGHNFVISKHKQGSTKTYSLSLIHGILSAGLLDLPGMARDHKYYIWRCVMLHCKRTMNVVVYASSQIPDHPEGSM